METLPFQTSERRLLCDLMTSLGPDAPTLCEGWTTYDMAAHLYVREHDPVAGVGLVVPPASGLHDKAIDRVKERRTFTDLVRSVRSGPPVWWRPLDGVVNVQEMFVHHEDVRRGGGDNEPRPESDIGDLEERLWGNLRRAHILMTRSIKGVRVVLETPELEPIRAGKGDEAVTISGRPGEVVLFLLGRRAAAQVDISGSDAAQAALSRANLGI